MKFGQIEVFLVQVIIFTVIYLVDAYVGFLICLVLGCIAVSLLMLSLIFEFIDRSKVPKDYYFFMLNTIIATLGVLICFTLFTDGSLDWMRE